MSGVPIANIIVIGISFFICMALPIGAFIHMKCNKASGRSMLLGAGTFIVFALILEQMMHGLVLQIAGSDFPARLVPFAIYAGLAAGVFEETGRFVTMKFLMKHSLTKKESIMYGVGHGGIEVLFVGALSCFSNLITAIMYNQGALDPVLETAGEQAMSGINQLIEFPAWMFLLVAFERISAFALHICLSFFVYKAVKLHKYQYFVMAIIIHALVDSLTVLGAQKVSTLTVEVILFLCMLIFVYITRKMYQKTPVSS